MISEVALGLVSSALHEGLKHPVTAIKSAATRRAELGKALDGTSASNEQASRAAAALADLARVIAHRYNEYSERVDEFLSEIKRSAIPSTLTHLLMCSLSPDEIKPAFDCIYNTYTPLPFGADELFDAYCTAVRLRLEEAVKDKELLSILQAQVGDLRQRVDDVRRALSSADKLKTTLSYDQYRDAKLKLAKAVEAANRDVAVETDRGTKRVLINKIVISARLSLTDGEKIAVPSPDGSGDGQKLSLSDFKRSFYRAVVLGDPGGGKSTLTQLLCYDLAKRISVEAQNTKRPGFEPRDLLLPLKITLRSFDKKQKQDPSFTLIDHIVNELRVVLDNDPAFTEAFLLQTLAVGNAILLFDGLDEILDVGRRRQIVEIVEQFITAYAACPVLVTSRVVGYKDAPMADGFNLYTLARFNRHEIGTFAEKLIKAIGGARQKEAKDLSLRFLRQTETTAPDLRENPLLLGLMVYLFVEKDDVPDNRPEIYRACSHLMFLRWDQRRDILFEYPDDFELLDLFGHVAFKIFGNADDEEGVSEDWLSDEVKRFFEGWYSDRARASAAAKSLIRFITGRAWVMCDVGPRTYKFTHRTFMEYFVARRIESQSESLPKLLAFLYPRIVKAEWDVVSHLALQIAASSGPKALMAVNAMEDILDTRKRTTSEELNYLNFVARALEYLPVPESKYKLFVLKAMRRAADLGARNETSSIGVFFSLATKAKKKTEIFKETFNSFVEEDLKSRDASVRNYAKYILAERQGVGLFHYYLHRRAITDTPGKFGDILRPTRIKFRERLMAEARMDVASARAFILIYNDGEKELFEIHGVDLLFEAGELFPWLDNTLFPLMLIGAAVEQFFFNHQAEQERLEAIAAFARLVMKQGLNIPSGGAQRGSRDFRLSILSQMCRLITEIARRRSRQRLGPFFDELVVYLFVMIEIEDARGAPTSRKGLGWAKVPRKTCLNALVPSVAVETALRKVASPRVRDMLADWTLGKRSFLVPASMMASGELKSK